MTKELDRYDRENHSDNGYIRVLSSNGIIDLAIADDELEITWKDVTYEELVAVAQLLVEAAAELKLLEPDDA